MGSAKYDLDSEESSEKCNIFAVFRTVLVRIVLIFHSFFAIWRVVDILNSNFFWLLGFASLNLIPETVYRICRKKNKGKEDQWFCPCLLIYSIGILPAIWILELEKINRYDRFINSNNVTTGELESLPNLFGVSIPLELNPDGWVNFMEQSFIFLLIAIRGILYIQEIVDPGKLFELFNTYISVGSDILDFFIVFEETEVRNDYLLSYISLGVWSLSVIYFSFVFIGQKETMNEKENKKSETKVETRFKDAEMRSLICLTLLLDFPYLVVRAYILIELQIFSFGIFFFTCKNVVSIIVVLNRLLRWKPSSMATEVQESTKM